jgi:hypothetical protein
MSKPSGGGVYTSKSAHLLEIKAKNGPAGLA